jgi:hypothetical protein
MASQYACQSCGITFEQNEIVPVHEGNNVHYVGDGRYLEDVEYDGCPYCLSINIDPIETDDE